jgi:nucleoside-diphosphate-sugar epimerase
MRIVVIGGSGHIGTYLIPMLIDKRHEVFNISRGNSKPYVEHPAWKQVNEIVVDRDKEEQAGTFGQEVAKLNPDVVIDLICFTEASVKHLVESLRGKVQHFLHCGTIWVYGHSTSVPATEDLPRYPFGEYGIQKAAIEAYLLKESRQNNFPATILHPGHIVGPGYSPLNPAGHFNPEVFATLARGEELAIANFGLETVHHVHASDVAQGFYQAMKYWRASVGESFHTVSPAALTLRGYAEAVATWFGQKPNLKFLAWEEWKTTVSETEATATWEHIIRSPNASIDKARRLINYQPIYTSLDAVYESVQWLIANGKISI